MDSEKVQNNRYTSTQFTNHKNIQLKYTKYTTSI